MCTNLFLNDCCCLQMYFNKFWFSNEIFFLKSESHDQEIFIKKLVDFLLASAAKTDWEIFQVKIWNWLVFYRIWNKEVFWQFMFGKGFILIWCQGPSCSWVWQKIGRGANIFVLLHHSCTLACTGSIKIGERSMSGRQRFGISKNIRFDCCCF